MLKLQELCRSSVANIVIFECALNKLFCADISFEWRILNNGSATAVGYKCDSVYLSTDIFWQITDTELGDPQCTRVSIPGYANNFANDRTFRYTTPTPFVAQAGYFGIVRSRSNIRDPNLENNIDYTFSQLQVNAPALELGVLREVELFPGEDLVFRIDGVPSEETLIAALTVGEEETSVATHELFLRYNNPPLGYEYDAYSQLAFTQDQRAVVPVTKRGTYYLRIETSDRDDGEPHTVNILVKIAVFEIASISPTRTGSCLPGTVTLRFSGTKFSYFLEASLINDLDSSISFEAEVVYWFSSEEAYATFNTSVLIPGTYTPMLIDKKDGEVATLSGGFEVGAGIPGRLSMNAQAPRFLSGGERTVVSIYFLNVGDSDIYPPVLIASSSTGVALLRLLDEDASKEYSTQIVFLPTSDVGPGGIIPPGGYSQVYFQVQSRFVTGGDTIVISNIPDKNEPHIYLDQKVNLKPSEMPMHVWEMIWSNFLQSVGSTWNSLTRRLSEIATSYSLVGKRFFDVNDLVSHQVQVAYGMLTGTTLLFYSYRSAT